jgi:hypothetical protein
MLFVPLRVLRAGLSHVELAGHKRLCFIKTMRGARGSFELRKPVRTRLIYRDKSTGAASPPGREDVT